MEKVKMRKTRKRHFSEIKGSEKHTTEKEKNEKAQKIYHKIQIKINSCR